MVSHARLQDPFWQAMRQRVAAVAGLATCGAGVTAALWAWPTCTSVPTAHAPFTDRDQRALCYVSTSGPVPPEWNPGIRVWPGFLSDQEATALRQELQPLKAKHGLSLISPQHAAVYRWQQSYLPRAQQAPVNMLRITGRPEAQAQSLPPWRYGDECDEAALPPRLRALVQRVRALPGIRLGPLRDVTINYRHSRYFRLDPHVDPKLDGGNVFIIGLDSDTVLTFTPERFFRLWRRGVRWAWEALTLADEREGVRQDAERSWTPLDLDVLAPARTLVHFSGDARWTWTHGTRLGVPVEGREGLHDWWGSPEHVVLRQPERHSVVLAFADAPPTP